MNASHNIPTGFPAIDDTNNELIGGELMIIGGRPAMGKTTFAMSIAKNTVLKYSKSVVFFSLELSSSQIAKRYYEHIYEKEFQNVFRNQLFVEDKQKDVSGIIKTLEEIKKDSDFDLIIIDYFQLMTGKAEKNIQDLKTIALKYDIPLILISQLKMEVDQRVGEHKPEIADLADINGFLKIIDSIWFVYRPHYYHLSSDESIFKIIIAKQSGSILNKETDLNCNLNKLFIS